MSSFLGLGIVSPPRVALLVAHAAIVSCRKAPVNLFCNQYRSQANKNKGQALTVNQRLPCQRITGCDRHMTASVQDTTKPLVTAKLYTGKELCGCVHVSANFAQRGHI